MNEIKGVSGIDVAVKAMVDDIECRTTALVADISELATIVTTEENLQARKADRAAVNKRRAEFDGERKDVEKKWKGAIAPVSNAYKEAVAQCDKVISAIDQDLKVFEAQRIEAKKELIVQIYESIECPEGIGGWYDIVDMYNPKWENASYSEKQIRKDITDALGMLKISYDTLKSLHHEWEEEGLKVLRDTKDLQKAISAMNELAEHQRMINEKMRLEEERRKALEEEAELKKREEAAKEDTKEVEAVIEPVLHAEPIEEISQTPFGPFGNQQAEDLPFGEQKESTYIVHVAVKNSDSLNILEGMLIGLYDYTVEEKEA